MYVLWLVFSMSVIVSVCVCVVRDLSTSSLACSVQRLGRPQTMRCMAMVSKGCTSHIIIYSLHIMCVVCVHIIMLFKGLRNIALVQQ